MPTDERQRLRTLFSIVQHSIDSIRSIVPVTFWKRDARSTGNYQLKYSLASSTITLPVAISLAHNLHSGNCFRCGFSPYEVSNGTKFSNQFKFDWCALNGMISLISVDKWRTDCETPHPNQFTRLSMHPGTATAIISIYQMERQLAARQATCERRLRAQFNWKFDFGRETKISYLNWMLQMALQSKLLCRVCWAVFFALRFVEREINKIKQKAKTTNERFFPLSHLTIQTKTLRHEMRWHCQESQRKLIIFHFTNLHHTFACSPSN